MAQQNMTSSDLQWPFHASRAISAVAELLLLVYMTKTSAVVGDKMSRNADRKRAVIDERAVISW